MPDDIPEVVLEGDAYERACMLTSRVFAVSLTGKVRLCVAALASTGILAPSITARAGLVERLEPGGGPPAFADVAALGVAVTFLFGLAFLRQRRLVRTVDLDAEAAARLVRFEDVLMALAVSAGFLFALVPVALALVGVASPDAVASLYKRGVRLYRPAGVPGVDPWAVSVGGVALAVGLLALEAAGR